MERIKISFSENESSNVNINVKTPKLNINSSEKYNLVAPTYHRDLLGLSYEQSGHTGFASEEALNELKNKLDNYVKNDFSGDYNDLINKPTIPTNTNQLTNGSGYITKDVNNLEYYFTKEYITRELEKKANTKEVYSIEEIDTKIKEVNNKIDTLELSDYYKKTETYSKVETNNLLNKKEDKANLKALAYKDSLGKSDVGLGNVDNTSDLNKPISTATQSALNNKANKADVYTKIEVDNTFAKKTELPEGVDLSLYLKTEDAEKTYEAKTNLKALAYKDNLSKEDIGLGNVNNVAITENQVNQIGINKSNIEQAQTNISKNANDIIALQTRAINIESKNNSQDTNISNLDTRLTSNESKTNINSSDIETLKNENATQNTNIINAQNTANEAKSIAEGRAKTTVFETFAEMQTYLKGALSTEFKKGDNLLIKALNVPDYWISNVLTDNTGIYGYYEISVLETQKVDLSGYQAKNLTTKVNVNGVEVSSVENAINELNTQKVNVETGKGLSTEDYTTNEKQKLEGIEENANNYVLPSDVVQDANYVHTDNNFTNNDKSKLNNLSNYDDTNIKSNIKELQDNKVDKVTGKQLSTNDYTNEEKEKLSNLVNYDDTEVKQGITNLQNNKVDKVSGKGLSSNDLTNELLIELKDKYTKEETNNLVKNNVMIEIGDFMQETPSINLPIGGLFFKEITPIAEVVENTLIVNVGTLEDGVLTLSSGSVEDNTLTL